MLKENFLISLNLKNREDINFEEYPFSVSSRHRGRVIMITLKLMPLRASGWYETYYSQQRQPIVVSLIKVFLTDSTGRGLSLGNCIWKLRKDIDEERKIRTYTVCEICGEERITSDTGEQTQTRTRVGAVWTVITTGFPFNLNPKGKASVGNSMSCFNPATGNSGVY